MQAKTECKINVNGKILEQANVVVHLGSTFSRDRRYERDSKRRIAADNRVNGAYHLAVCNAVLGNYRRKIEER